MIFTFYKARGLKVGKSLVEEPQLALAKELEAKAKAKGVQLLLPTDVVIADDFKPDANSKVCGVSCLVTQHTLAKAFSEDPGALRAVFFLVALLVFELPVVPKKSIKFLGGWLKSWAQPGVF